ncbi:cbb3-type cytochrome c oxidase subunit I [Methylobacterium sp. J-088]|uniref:cbb3-type cytochrome c oxidase subunit I n=1 Tax=Methylobacterium sp. J-088 TaxID=2836664 RepID=UPI001FBA98B6|nr:cbb3-type cytochrome c oxidase subunit I [Methylobacterium sp. J-088]MCJ2065399.1 cbb3-type cytochrome c oxidase subunit I [Methylobacterium sp. J-088]
MSGDVWFWLFGRLDAKALPFVRAWDHPTLSEFIGAMAGGMVVVGAVVLVALLTWQRWWRPLFLDWLTSLDHKKIGIMYVVIAGVMLTRALIEAVLMRTQQSLAVDAPGIVAPEHFAQLFSTHGTIMVFFMAMPFLTGLINFAMPLQIGARDVAFPLLNSISLMLTAAGAGLVMISLAIGDFSTGGWSGYPPYTGKAFQPGVGPDYWIWAITLTSLGTTFSGLNFAATIYKKRCPGMHLMRMPLFCWTALCTSILMVFAMPPLTLATALLALDRYADFHFFTNDLGGNMMNYVNLFWLFGHPEVYILILPAFGVYSEVISAFSSKELYGYTSLVLATMAIGILSFTVWLHHFFTMGQSADVNAAFGIATMTIGVPTGVKVYDWIWTMFRGEVRFTTPMLFSIAFIVTFVLGGFSGILLAVPPIDFVVHNTVFLVAHFHNVIIPGTLYGVIAGYMYWFPKAFGFRLVEGWGKVSFACWVVGFYLAFMPLYVLGLGGMPRRSQALFEPDYRPWLIVAVLGAFILLAGLVTLFVQLAVSVREREKNRVPVGDPWDARSLEWSVSAPPPEYNFATIPHVGRRDVFYWRKAAHGAYKPADHYRDITVPRNSWVGPIVGLGGAACGFGLVWHIWWMTILGFAAVWITVIGRSFVRDTHRVISAAEVEATDRAWLAQVSGAHPIPRQLEESPKNFGLAESFPAPVPA